MRLVAFILLLLLQIKRKEGFAGFLKLEIIVDEDTQPRWALIAGVLCSCEAKNTDHGGKVRTPTSAGKIYFLACIENA